MTQYVTGQPKPPGSGRKKGTGNRVNKKIRKELDRVVLETMPKIPEWLDRAQRFDSESAAVRAFTQLLTLSLKSSGGRGDRDADDR